MVFLNKALFTTYLLPSNLETQDGVIDNTPFQISLSALLEALQIFGVTDIKDRWSSRDPSYGGVSGSIARGGLAAAFDNRILGMTGVCRLSYGGLGEPLCLVMEETGVTTTCELVTYEPELEADIPLQKDALTHRIIMRASWLYDAINELSSTSPTRITIVVSPAAPHFTLSSAGPIGSATVEFTKDPQLLETFEVHEKTVNTYKYSLIKQASRAMAMATKVSMRTDEQGVLNLQLMIDVEGGGMSFVDFKFVPYIPEEGDEQEEDEDEEEVERETVEVDTERGG